MFSFTATPAHACTPAAELYGFEAWVDGAVDVPTDVRLVVLASGVTPEITLAPAGGGAPVELVSGSGLWDLAHDRDPFTPVDLLEPDTMYRATVAHDDDVFTATTTGGGPAGDSFAPPTLRVEEVTAWELGDWYQCILGSPVVGRFISVTIELDGGPPVGSYVAVRSPGSQGDYDAVEVADAASVAFTVRQGEHEDRPDAVFARHDCLTPVFLAPSGAEVEGAPVCVEPPGCGCGTTPARAPAGWVAAAAAVWCRARRPTPGRVR
jgi:hypothetical protein